MRTILLSNFILSSLLLFSFFIVIMLHEIVVAPTADNLNVNSFESKAFRQAKSIFGC